MTGAHAAPSGTPAGALRTGPLVVYGYYRILLSAALLLLFVVELDRAMRLGTYQPALYLAAAGTYFVVCLVSTFAVRLLHGREALQGVLLTGIDIVALTVLVHASGGPSSSVAPLLVVTVAAGAILLPGRTALLPAAVATLAMLYEQFYFSLSRGLPLTTGSTLVGLLGMAFFGIAIAIAQLSRRLRESEALARQRTEEVHALEDLNAHIIQRMRTGILVIGRDDRVLLANSAARQLLGPDTPWPARAALPEISPELARRVATWRREGETRELPFRNQADRPEVNTSMTPVTIGGERATLVFLEDWTALGQHLQQMKLASLGRLAASIAHEIRNPLSAISHAAQLLNESPALPREDVRLAEIIQQQALRLDRIVDNVLHLSRRQAPRADQLDLDGWLRQFRADFLAHHGADDEVVLRPTAQSVKVRADPNHLQQVLQNLCDNGVRHGRKATGRGRVVLESGLNAQTGEPWLRVIDNGPGVPPAQQPNLFEPFFTTESGGTGLGLYLARELCEANRARLAYQSAAEAPDGAAAFRITFAHPGRIAS